MRLVDADKLKENIIKNAKYTNWLDRAIAETPTIEPKRGRWIEKTVKEGSPFFWRRFYCTACGDWTTHGKSKFCPNCGARMDGEK